MRFLRLLLVLAAALPAAGTSAAPSARVDNVVLVVCDGLRWQEVFSGADPALLADPAASGNARTRADLERRFGGPDAATRRARLFPFVWSTVASGGQLFGNLERGSRVAVTNGVAISYPGYHELLTGRTDPRIDRNEFGPNPDATVFEWLNTQPGLAGRSAVFGTWSVLADLFNPVRSHLPVRVGPTLVDRADSTPEGRLLAGLYDDSTSLYGSNAPDAFVAVALRRYLAHHRPRLLFVGYGDTDLWAHMGRYDLVLETARRFDDYVAQLWAQLQALNAYRGRTVLILTADHGRGVGPVDWREHGAAHPGSADIWLAVLGPGIAALGERHDVPSLAQAQIAATVAAFVGRDFLAAAPGAAAPLGAALSAPGR
ncbi:MAG: alkaline phosphatase family protein [Proteobacteria bacterium]|nr:alkaline phosphatase family protein [Pseudomonadota bacterium]